MNADLESLIAKLRANGLAYPCTMCRKMWRTAQRGESFCEAQRDGLPCNGPPTGGLFPLYDGPLTKEHLASHCFACGDDASATIAGRLGGTRGGLGVCKRHLPLVERVVPMEAFESAKEEPAFTDYRKSIQKS